MAWRRPREPGSSRPETPANEGTLEPGRLQVPGQPGRFRHPGRSETPMQTSISPELKSDPGVQVSEEILRTCVHCGFCNATCPTYLLTGNELEGPRGRIYLIKNMLEGRIAPTASTVEHIDNCLACLACETTCPQRRGLLPSPRGCAAAAGETPPQGVGRPPDAGGADAAASLAGAVPVGDADGRGRQAGGIPYAAAFPPPGGDGPAFAAGPFPPGGSRGEAGRGCAHAGGPAHRLRPAGARPRRSTTRRSGCSFAAASKWWCRKRLVAAAP